MTYKELKIGQEIDIKEKADCEDGKPHNVQKKYRILKKYPHMCMEEDINGRKRGLSLGDLVINKIIKQDAHIEAIKKKSCK